MHIPGHPFSLISAIFFLFSMWQAPLLALPLVPSVKISININQNHRKLHFWLYHLCHLLKYQSISTRTTVFANHLRIKMGNSNISIIFPLPSAARYQLWDAALVFGWGHLGFFRSMTPTRKNEIEGRHSSRPWRRKLVCPLALEA